MGSEVSRNACDFPDGLTYRLNARIIRQPQAMQETEMATVLSHIVLDDDGVARIEGSTTKVKEVILDWLAYGYSPAEIHFQYPYLSLAQIYSAFAYYHDHQAEMDAEIARDYAEIEELRARTPPPITRAELLKRQGSA